MGRKKPTARKSSSTAKCACLLALLCAAAFVCGGVLWWLSARSPQIELPYLTARQVAVLDADTGRFVCEMDADVPHSPASLTKLMTVLLVLDDIEAGTLDWEDTYTVTLEEANALGSKYGMRPGEVFTVRQLVAGTVMVSGCDCVQCLVKLCAGNEAAFVRRMNGKAKELGMDGSNFANATGIDAAGHYMTARDVARLARALVEDHPEILDFTSAPSLQIGERTFKNIHRLVGFDPRVKGLKTGTTRIGGFNVCTYAEEDGHRYVIVLLDSSGDNTRFSETVDIMDALFGES